MTVRRSGPTHNHVVHLTGWSLVAAITVIAVVIIATLLITRSPEATTVVTVPLLLALGAVSTSRS